MKVILTLLATLSIGGCVSASQHAEQVQSNGNISVGVVQKQIKVGMSGADVLQALGSPNMVSTDDQRREVWVYDKVATDTVQSSSTGWVFAVLAGGQTSSGASSRSQRTLTIIIKFDEQNLVRDFAYHSSKF
ncbi:outer membrane protein assembly factor BamE [Psychrobacter pulmonis]|uniref:outer membrane protein assembly factor BamE n=1 Tax=Psychrobacter pulmonis TaxID=228654 RepID=UPI00191926BB|nr:outer membrane protein assembly factor BamE [Psychrobacter pulmonis]